MSLLSRLESKVGRFAVPNVTVLLIGGQVLLYIAHHLDPGQGGANILERVRMYPQQVLAGEYWRLVTFLFDPPGMNPIFAFFFWYMFYMMGTTLEISWGVFRYNMFLAIGYVASLVCAFGAYFINGANMPAFNVFLEGTVFLAFARLFPDFVLYIFLILPVKIKWLAMLTWIVYSIQFLFGSWMARAMVFASVLNYILFFGIDIWRNVKQGHRRMQFQSRTLRAPPRIVHTCAVCGLTSDASPQTQFRYCSKCEGERCYCPEHLQNHEHATRQVAGTTGDERG